MRRLRSGWTWQVGRRARPDGTDVVALVAAFDPDDKIPDEKDVHVMRMEPAEAADLAGELWRVAGRRGPCPRP